MVPLLDVNEQDKGITGMHVTLTRRVSTTVMIVLAIVALLTLLAVRSLVAPPKTHAAASATAYFSKNAPLCEVRPQLCTEPAQPWDSQGNYIGHDEPSLLFYSTVPGSGNSTLSTLTLPTDPVAPPTQDGTGSTWNFQLHPTFWYGMIMCDDQSAPNPGATCTPDSDKNIFTSTNPNSANYLGNTPGEAFMEMQFYPPGWGPISCTDANGNQDGKWCAALNIDSWQANFNTGVNNNAACVNEVNIEPVNYAVITKSGHSQVPARPDTGFGNQAVVTADTLEFNNGDTLVVDMHDTAAGFQVVIHDVTTGQSGSMTASIANGFGHPLYQPNASTCTFVNYAFHPMFSTSTADTRVLWAAHSYNAAFSDEIGHFQYCNSATTFSFRCDNPAGYPNPSDASRDSDDRSCFGANIAPFGTGANVIAPNGTDLEHNFTGCVFSNADFSGPEYQAGTWPGSSGADPAKVSTPIQFTSPLFTGSGSSGLFNYQQVAFETNLPRIEGADVSPNNACQRHVANPTDPSPGAGCVNPPNGATFYPIYSTSTAGGACIWQEGGSSIPGTTNNFGGTSAAEYGGLQVQNYPAAGGIVQQLYETFHRTLDNNPCLNPGGKSGD